MMLMDLVLISSTQQQMQEKTFLLAETSINLGLRPNESKTKVMTINVKRKQPIKIKVPISDFVEPSDVHDFS
jgi:hypothetical protein